MDDATSEEEEEEEEDGANVLPDVIRVNLVDAAGVVLCLRFAAPLDSDGDGSGKIYPRLLPASDWPLAVVSAPSLALDRGLRLHPGTALTPSTVDFLSADRVIVALSPHLLCVDLGISGVRRGGLGGTRDGGRGAKLALWTEGRCVVGPDGRDRRRSSIGSILRSAGSIMLGMAPEDDGDDDDEDGDEEVRARGGGGTTITGGGPAASVAALCAARQSSRDENGSGQEGDATLVFTLHGDGSCRIWEVPPFGPSSRSLRPRRCRKVCVPLAGGGGGGNPPLPPPRTWSTGVEAVSLTGRTFRASPSSFSKGGGEGYYALAVYVRTVDGLRVGGVGVDDPSDSDGLGPCHILIFHGPSNFKVASGRSANGAAGGENGASVEGEARDVSLTLSVPSGSARLADMSFIDRPDGLPELRALFDCNGCNHWGGGGDGWRRRAMLASYPPSHTGLSPLNGSPVRFGIVSTVDDGADDGARRIASLSSLSLGAAKTTEDLDRLFLKEMFRPPLGDEAYTRPGPSDRSVRSALKRLVPSHKFDPSGSGGRSSAAEVMLAMREWRGSEEGRAGATNTLSIAIVPSGRAMVIAPKRANVAGDIYSAFATPRLVRRRQGVEGESGGRRNTDRETTGTGRDVDRADLGGGYSASDAKDSDAQATARLLSSHRDRWVRLIRAVRDGGTSALRAPLRMACPPPLSSSGGPVCCEEVVSTVDDGADDGARRIASLSSLSLGAAKTTEDLDRLFLKEMFRPPLGDEAYTRPGPSDRSVRSALKRLVPSHKFDPSGSGGRSSAAEVMLAMREWRGSEEGRAGATNTLSIAIVPSGRAMVIAPKRANVAGDIYSAFATPRLVRRRQGVEGESGGRRNTDRETTGTGRDVDRADLGGGYSASDAKDSDAQATARLLSSHRDRWVRLIRAVRDGGTSALRAPLRMACPPPLSSSGGPVCCEEVAIVVRGGVASALIVGSSPPRRRCAYSV